MNFFSKSVLIVIPARKNSVRLKNKNLRKINGKTLVENSIVFAKKFKKISNVVLSTDSEKIKNIVKKNYPEVLIHERQKKFSGSKSSTLILINRIIKWYRSKFKKKINSILLLQPTTPFRNYSLIKKTLINLNKDKIKTNYVSVSSNKLKNNINMNWHNKLITISEKKNPNCYVNGSFYIFRKHMIDKDLKKTIMSFRTKGVIIDRTKYLIDIDNYDDLKFAKKFEK
jgi:CMP-N-acetylneuraminic acid synthetase